MTTPGTTPTKTTTTPENVPETGENVADSQPRRITLEDVLAIAREHPDSKNPECCYFGWNDEPCCIVGHALARAGWTRADLLDLEPTRPFTTVNDAPCNQLPELFASPEDMTRVARLQDRADVEKVNWGTAAQDI